MKPILRFADPRGGTLWDMGMATEQTVYKVEVSFHLVDACDRERLEALSVEVMEAIDEHTSDAVLGASAAAVFEPPELELDILVRAASPADLHRKLSEILEILEKHAGLETAKPGSSYVESSRPDAELVPA
jgi:hypothetical protein